MQAVRFNDKIGTRLEDMRRGRVAERTVKKLAINVHLSAFDGPLDLLLYLIEKNRLSIYDIPIFEITQQFLAYLKEWESLNMDIASEFIVMAATLINIKARMLMPSQKTEDGEEEDPKEVLVRRLAEYQSYRQAAQALRKSLLAPDRQILCRGPETIRGERPVPPAGELLKGLSLEQLYALYERALAGKRESYDAVRSSFRSVERDVFPLEEKIDALSRMLEILRRVSYFNLRESSRSKAEAITFFQAMLELSRMNLATLSQDGEFGDIIMKPKQEGIQYESQYESQFESQYESDG